MRFFVFKRDEKKKRCYKSIERSRTGAEVLKNGIEGHYLNLENLVLEHLNLLWKA